ncbi:unnamed protein product [Brugia pahangi]|uniref:Uncharacterized protein n=1 Tax=Brugia pahangi TaxID=6280 RepID=A0A0N4TTC7_BRUPA|nr:unnamed protein product [Brugia pahangi]
MNAQNLQINSSKIFGMDIMRTENSRKWNEISSATQDSDTQVIWTNSSATRESQSTQNSTKVEEDDHSLARIDMKSKSIYFSDPVSSEYHLKVLSSVECRTSLTSLQNQSVDEILSGDVFTITDSRTEYSITELKSSDTVSMMDTNTDAIMQTDSISNYKKYLSNNYSEFAITEAAQQMKVDEIATAEEVCSLSGTFMSIDYDRVITELEAYLNAN